ncbi:hypothetical protein FGIG_01047 [Fasciola gigantica]|uniref:Ig-like domain-containing protein n=1 Tax=Fasciola gigantica TaxID=46835 RepID=A0A504YSV8_FASGI|nr:hypothetical protein FGIG_01047 [Fasciola gigantica]
MEIQQGAVLSLKCQVKGETNPVIRWYKDDILIDPEQNERVDIIKSVKRSQLRLRNIQLNDSGNYSCKGESAQSQNERWIYVNVYPTTEEGNAADKSANSPCPVNRCNRGHCLLINNKPHCRCPSTHTGPQCTEPVTPVLQTPAVHGPPKSTTIEDDFLLDQSVASYPDSYRTLLEPLANKCDLPEYQYTSECAQVNSHFYAFVGTAVACSVIILLLGSCLGYIRRRKILRLQENGEKLPRKKSCEVPSDSTPLHDTSASHHSRVGPFQVRQDSPIFAPTPKTTSLGKPSWTPTRENAASDSPRTWASETGHDSMTRLAMTTLPIKRADREFTRPAYVVLTTSTPVALHPLEQVATIQSSTRVPVPTNRAVGPANLTPWMPTDSQSIETATNVNTPFADGIFSVGFLEPTKGAHRSDQGLPISPSCSAHTDRIYVHIPPLGAPIYLSNQLNAPTHDSVQLTKCPALIDRHPSDSGITDTGSELVTPLSHVGMFQTSMHNMKISPELKRVFRPPTTASITSTTTAPNSSVISSKHANPDCIPLNTPPCNKVVDSETTKLPTQSDPTSLVTFKCTGSGDHK